MARLVTRGRSGIVSLMCAPMARGSYSAIYFIYVGLLSTVRNWRFRRYRRNISGTGLPLDKFQPAREVSARRLSATSFPLEKSKYTIRT
ncbi:PREDICTED: uncharacterized protein LOC105564899 isoform X1 [Vollenhovia emeryi]|uniref:uncharacterized protein LOC105564899 isoform X1 n=1 Tax=Vollenhovia emeryi TaxID=411798 RepID=UPI0005F3E89E|nr:PREDICTED: uncharacterized protein LOC105564899 isoform X1 [Vollenhovia emeryi]